VTTSVYNYGDNLYVNLTNRCPVACLFCAKRSWAWRYRGWNLKLGPTEPSEEAIAGRLAAALKRYPFKEVVFCGYGEPTYRLSALLAVARRLRRDFPKLKLRLNTIGLGSLICGRDIVPELKSCLDAVSVSLNTADPAQWITLHAPQPGFRQRGFAGAVDFIKGCAVSGLDTTMTAVVQPGVNLAALRSLARRLGVRFRSRPLLNTRKPISGKASPKKLSGSAR
jgi:TatD DNase family protein